MKIYFVVFCLAIAISSCVSKKEYDSLLDKYMQTQVEKSNTDKNLSNLQSETEANKLKLSQAIEKLKLDSTNLSELIENMKAEMENLETEKEKLALEQQQKLKNALNENQKTNAELLQMQIDLEKQKQALDQKEKSLQNLQNEILQKSNRITELEKSLNEQKLQSENLKNTIKNALTQFNAGELEVYSKDGKVYVSMSDKLLFKSGSTAVEPKGIEALGKLADVIKKNTDIMVNVEGHTDNVPYKSSISNIKDNWDLSLMRASSVLHILTEKYFVSRLQLMASGKGEFSPKASNVTPEGKAQNRRTEIILTPKIDKVMQLLNN
jgi:chemotaxis protein MotB